MPMSIAANLLPEYDMEMTSTRRVLALVPEAHADWKPHPKSFPLSGLALHLANLPTWGMLTVTRSELDLASPEMAPQQRDAFSTTAALLARFDDEVAAFRRILADSPDSTLQAMWTLKSGSMTLFTMPRTVVLRSSVINHMIHHRGQMTVYLRMLDVPLPDLYGPTADTKRG